MEERLRPINGLLGLTAVSDINAPALRDAGFRVAGLEVPVTTPLGKVVVDLVLYHEETALIVACEAKSGRNVEHDQAQKYARLDARTVVLASRVTLTRRITPRVAVLYACLDEHVATVRIGLEAAGIGCAIFGVGERVISVDRRDPQPEALDAVLVTGDIALVAPPPRIIEFDQDSPVEAIMPAIKAQLVAELSHRREQVTVPMLVEQAAPHFALYAANARKTLIKKAEQAAQQIAAAESSTFEYVPRQPNDHGAVRLLRTPEDNDLRGRTQAYQALARSNRPARRRSQPVDPNQLDLLREVALGDDEGIEDNLEDTEEAQ